MKKIVLVSVVLMVVIMCGCQTEMAYQVPGTQQIVSAEDFLKLPITEQAKYEKITVESIRPEILSKAETGLVAATGGYTVVRPFIPEPYAASGALLLGVLGTILTMLKKVKNVKGTLAKVSLGAQITATTIDNVVRPAAELFETFKDAQRKAEAEAKKNGLPPIMPDDL